VMEADPPQRAARASQLWAAAADALADGDYGAFAGTARAAALSIAASGDLHASVQLAEVRGEVLELRAPTDTVLDPLADTLRRGPGVAGIELRWRYLHALATSAPHDHPLAEEARTGGWDAVALELVVAVLWAGPRGATLETLAGWAGRAPADFAEVATGDGPLVTSGVLVLSEDRVAPNLTLWAVSVHAPSPFEPVVAPSLSSDHGIGDLSGGVSIVLGPTVDDAMAAALRTTPRPLRAPTDELGLAWAARDARWRARPLVAVLAAPGPVLTRLLVTGQRLCIVASENDPMAAWLVMHLGAVRDVHSTVVPSLTPADAAERLAGALATQPERLRVGELYPGDVDSLASRIAARGEDARWVLAAELVSGLRAALPPGAVLAGPLSPGAAAPIGLERARDLLDGTDPWSSRTTVLLVVPELAVRLAVSIADERGGAAAVVSLMHREAWATLVGTLRAIKRFGGVLVVVDVANASPVVAAAMAQAVLEAGVTTVLALAPGSSPPVALARRAGRV